MALSRLGEPAETFEAFVNDAKQPWPLRTAALTVLAGKKPVLAGQLAAGVAFEHHRCGDVAGVAGAVVVA
jgi:hypothetical protein